MSSEAEPTFSTVLDFYAALSVLQKKTGEADTHRRNAAAMREVTFAQHELVHINDTLLECNKLVTSMMEGSERVTSMVESRRVVAVSEEITSWLITISFVYFHLKQYQ